MACLSTVVAVGLAGFTAVHSDVTNLTTPKDKKKLKIRILYTSTKKKKLSNFLKSPLTGNISPYHKASGCDQTHRRSSTSARWRGRSHEPCGRLCHKCSRAALSPSWAPCSPGRCDHSCGSCSTLDTKEVVKKGLSLYHL